MAAAATKLPATARCVVVGGGVAGTSAAYHLARKAGWSDTLVLERDKLTSGTTWHAAGLMGRIAGSDRVTRMRRYSAEIYQELAEELDMSTGYVQNGGLTLATSQERLQLIERWQRKAAAIGTDCHIVSKEECMERSKGVINCDDVIGGLWSPDDGQINPVDATMVMAAAARKHGATIMENTAVTKIITRDGKVCGVETDKGVVECEKVLLCGGMWSQQIAKDAGASVPLWPCEHEYFLTEAMPEAAGLPVVRSYDEYLYIKEDAGRVLVGLFEPNAKTAFRDVQRVPEDFSFGSFPDDMDHLEPYLMSAMHRVPLLAERGIQSYFSGPESFTPDGTEVLGECPDLKNLFVCTGFNSHGITVGPAAGDFIADWIDSGGVGLRKDWFGVDIRRFQGWMADNDFIKERCSETLGRQYGMTYPHQHHVTGRDRLMPPYQHDLAIRGGVFGLANGYERAEWFDTVAAGAGREHVPEYGWGPQQHEPATARECAAAREGVALFDQSSLSKIIIEGPDAGKALEHVCSAKVVRAVGRCVYTLMLNTEAGIESDCTVTRLEENKYLLSSGSAMRVKDKWWIEKNTEDMGWDFTVVDATDDYSVIGVFGPDSPELLTAASGALFTDEARPNGLASTVMFGDVEALAIRTAYTGEIGWELTVPRENAQAVYDAVTTVGEGGFGLVHAGVLALDALRVEAGHVRWGTDITAGESPADVGLEFAVSPKKAHFVGKEALDAGKGVRQMGLGLFKVLGIKAAGEPLVLAGEPLFAGVEGVAGVGEVTSANWSATYDCQLLICHVDGWVSGDPPPLQMQIGAERYDLEWLPQPPLPRSKRFGRK